MAIYGLSVLILLYSWLDGCKRPWNNRAWQQAEYHKRRPRDACGGMCEWLKQAVLKTALPARVTGVRIPLPPPLHGAVAASGCQFCDAHAGREPSPDASSYARKAAQVQIHLPHCALIEHPALARCLFSVRHAMLWFPLPINHKQDSPCCRASWRGFRFRHIPAFFCRSGEKHRIISILFVLNHMIFLPPRYD